MEMLERRIDKTAKMLKGDKSLQAEYDFMKMVCETLEQGRPARSANARPSKRRCWRRLPCSQKNLTSQI